jgi:hypothetical protein
MQFNALPSLPPGIEGQVYGLLTMEVGVLQWLASPAAVLFRVKFWGEKGNGLLMSSGDVQGVPQRIKYTLRCTQPLFAKYLSDMKVLQIEVLDNVRKRLLGSIKVQLNLYLKRDLLSAKGKLAPHSKIVNLEMDGVFPILSPDNISKAGDVELKAWTDFHVWKADVRDSTTSVTSFQLNELKAEFDDLPKTVLERVPHSLEQRPVDDRWTKPKEEEVKQPEVKAAGLRLARVKAVLPEGTEATPQVTDAVRSPPGDQDRWNALKERGQKLKQRMEAVVESDEASGVEVVPTVTDIQSYVMPEECFEPVKTAEPEKPHGDIHNMHKLLVQIGTLTLLAETSPPSIEVSLPLPYKEEGAEQVKVLTDSFKLHHKGGADNVYKFNHSSTHNIAFGEGFYTKLASLPIRFRLVASVAAKKTAEVSKAEVPWEKLFVSPNFTYSSVLEFKGEDTRKGKCDVAKLAVTLSLVREVPDSPQREEAGKTLLMYLHLDHAFQLVPRHDGSRRNLLVTYKTFPEKEQMNTPVLWNYVDETPLRHTSVVAVSDLVVEKLQSAVLVLEVWDKQPSNDELLGLVKLPLALFGTAWRAGAEVFGNSVYPMIAVDEYRPITSLRQECLGYLRVCLAMGSALQVRRLQDSHDPLDKVEPKVQSKQTAVQMTPPLSPTEVQVQTSAVDLPLKEPHREPIKEPLREPVKEPREPIKEPTREPVKEPRETIKEESPQRVSPAKVFESLESISDLAAFLNRREYREEVVQTDVMEESPVKAPLVREIPQEELLASVRAYVQEHAEDFDASLRALEGTVTQHQLMEVGLSLGLQEAKWQRVLDVFLEVSLESSSYAVKVSELRDFLELPVHSLRSLEHCFNIEVPELLSCPMLQREANCFLKLMLPVDQTSVESDYLPPRTRNLPLSLRTELTCIGEASRPLAELLNCEGVTLQLLQRSSESTTVVGQAVLPIEELTELSAGGTISRVLCIYAARNSVGNEVLGKVRLRVSYVQKEVWRPDASVELIYSKETCVERSIPRECYLTILVEGCSDLLKAAKHFQGYRLTGEDCFVRVDLFSEAEYSDVVETTESRPFSDSVAFHSMKFVELSFNEAVLRYFEAKSALVEVVCADLVIGSAKVPLVGLLLNGSIAGEFPLLGEFGQYRGCLSLSLSLSKEEPFIPKKIVEPLSSPPRVHQEQGGAMQGVPEQGVPMQVVVEAGLNLAKPSSGEAPNTYVIVLWNQQRLSTAPVLRSSCPAWHASFDLSVDPVKLPSSEVLLQVWHKSYTTQDQELGRCSVSLAPLTRVPEIEGWYHVQTPAGECGQLKVKVVPHAPLRKPLAELPVKEVPQSSRTLADIECKLLKLTRELVNDDDLASRHRSNMQALDDLTRKWSTGDFLTPSEPFKPVSSPPRHHKPVGSPPRHFKPVRDPSPPRILKRAVSDPSPPRVLSRAVSGSSPPLSPFKASDPSPPRSFKTSRDPSPRRSLPQTGPPQTLRSTLISSPGQGSSPARSSVSSTYDQRAVEDKSFDINALGSCEEFKDHDFDPEAVLRTMQEASLLGEVANSPVKQRRPPRPRSLMEDPEISRIAAIMKG